MGHALLKEVHFPLEVVILLVAGLALIITGILLFPVSLGMLPYYEEGLYGLFLVLFSLQTIGLGKTPFGDALRSNGVVAAGICIAGIGVIACFIPGILGPIPAALLFVCFSLGGFSQLLQLFLAREKYKTWIQYGGIFNRLIAGCGSVYSLSILMGLLVLRPSLMATKMVALLILIYGIAITYLAFVLKSIYHRYPEAETKIKGSEGLSTDKVMILLLSVFMLILGLLLIPVNSGILPFAANAQLGLLMTIFAIQMMALGSTPVGPFPRSRLMIVLGFLFASLGIVSIVIPGILVSPLTILVGLLNICGGIVTLWRLLLPRLIKEEKTCPPSHPILVKLFITQLALGLLSVLFGTSMLVSNLIDGIIIGIVLTSNGAVLLYLLVILVHLDRVVTGIHG
jgi:hypothetical protein